VNSANAAGQSVTAPERVLARSETTAVTVLLGAFLGWLALQTPVAIIAYQYGHLPLLAVQAILLAKDVFVALAIVVLAVRHIRSATLRWFDFLAIGYFVTVAVYSVVPYALGSRLPVAAVVASAREFLVPVELYALGRLAVLAGARTETIVRTFLVIGAIAAAFTVIAYAVLPVTFWSSTLDLVTFERVVQQIPSATTLWDISLLGQYGVGDSGSFARAVGPFTHPVATSHYFVLLLCLAVAGGFACLRDGRRRQVLILAGAAILFAAAIVTPISRGAWIASAIGVLLCGLLYRQLRIALIGLAVAAIVVVAVPPFSYAISSATARTDSSIIGHDTAVQHGLQTVEQNPLGLGLGQADQFGKSLSADASASAQSAGVGENMYLAVVVSVGPIGLLLLVGWLVGLLAHLIPRRPATPAEWMVVGTGASLVGYLVSALFASPLLRFTSGASFWLLAGLLLVDAGLGGLTLKRLRTQGILRRPQAPGSR
jgi:hypothetical protein